MSYYSGTVNAFPKGGTSSTDDRAGLGIGSLVKGPANGLGSNWSMGDALSSPKGEWDDEINDLEDEDDAELINLKSPTAGKVDRTDSYSHKGNSIGYFGGIGADMSSVLGLSAGYVNKGDLVFENKLKEFIRESILLERSKSSISTSGNIAVQSRSKAKNLGGKHNKAYPIDNTTLGSMGMTNGAYIGTINKVYKQTNKGTTDGQETIGGKNSKTKNQYIEDADDFNDGNATSKIYYQDYDNEYKDEMNVERFK